MNASGLFSIPLGAWLLLASAFPLAAADGEDRAELEAILRASQIKVSAEGIKDYLTRLIPSDAANRRAEQLVPLLGSNSFRDRTAATNELKTLVSVDVEKLRSFFKSAADPEVRYRLGRVIRYRSGPVALQRQLAAFKFLKVSSFEGMAAPTIRSFPYLLQDATLRKLAAASLQDTASRNDIDLLAQTIRAEELPSVLRAGALTALASLDADSAHSLVLSLCDQAEGQFAVQVARFLVQSKDRAALAVLLRQTKHEDAAVRHTAYAAIQTLTGLAADGNEAFDAQVKAFLEDDSSSIAFEWNVELWPALVSRFEPASETIEIPPFLAKYGKPIKSLRLLGTCRPGEFVECATTPEWHKEDGKDGIRLRYEKDLPPYRWYDFDIESSVRLPLRMAYNMGDADCNDGVWGLVWNRDTGALVARIESTGDMDSTYTVVEPYLKEFPPLEKPIWQPIKNDMKRLQEDRGLAIYGDEEEYAHNSRLEILIHIAIAASLDRD